MCRMSSAPASTHMSTVPRVQHPAVSDRPPDLPETVVRQHHVLLMVLPTANYWTSSSEVCVPVKQSAKPDARGFSLSGIVSDGARGFELSYFAGGKEVFRARAGTL